MFWCANIDYFSIIPPMNIITDRPLPDFCIKLTKGEIEVLALMGKHKFTIKQIKDAIQFLQTTDMVVIENYLRSTLQQTGSALANL